MKRKVIFMGLVVIFFTGNELFSRPQPVPTGIFNASWGTLAKQGAMVVAGAAVLGGLMYYCSKLAKKLCVYDSFAGFYAVNGVRYYRDYNDDKYYKEECSNGCCTKTEITSQEFFKEMEDFNKKFEENVEKISYDFAFHLNEFNQSMAALKFKMKKNGHYQEELTR